MLRGGVHERFTDREVNALTRGRPGGSGEAENVKSIFSQLTKLYFNIMHLQVIAINLNFASTYLVHHLDKLLNGTC